MDRRLLDEATRKAIAMEKWQIQEIKKVRRRSRARTLRQRRRRGSHHQEVEAQAGMSSNQPEDKIKL
jgi:hypothetical protein